MGTQAELDGEGIAAFSNLSQFLMSFLIYGCKKFVLIPYSFHYNLYYAVLESEEILMEDVKFSV